MGGGRALYTNRHGLVRSLPPMRPAIFLPFHTLPGSWQAPVAPGLRCALLLPCDAPCPAKPQRFIVPWNPLPMLVPAAQAALPQRQQPNDNVNNSTPQQRFMYPRAPRVTDSVTTQEPVGIQHSTAQRSAHLPHPWRHLHACLPPGRT